MQRARDARCGIANDDHPFDVSTGSPMESSDVQNRLEQHFKTLHAIVDQVELSLGAANRISKAERVLPSMIATIAFEQKAEQAADVFQRSSSCVEGRNGQLSLRHHGLRELTASKLRALRTIHNYVIRSPDGTTAAERFFANKPRDLFRWLLDQLPMPARPRQKKKNGAT